MVNCQVEKCACGCTLKTGTIIIGVLNLLGGIGGVLFLIENNSQSLNTTGLVNSVQLLIYTIISLLGLPIGILYIAGALKDKPRWLHIGIFMHLLVVIVVSFVYIYAGISILAGENRPQVGVFTIFKGLTNALFGAYFIMVVNSLRIQLEDGTGRNYNI